MLILSLFFLGMVAEGSPHLVAPRKGTWACHTAYADYWHRDRRLMMTYDPATHELSQALNDESAKSPAVTAVTQIVVDDPREAIVKTSYIAGDRYGITFYADGRVTMYPEAWSAACQELKE